MGTSADLFEMAIQALDDEITRYASLAKKAKWASWALKSGASIGFVIGILGPLADQAGVIESANALALGYFALAASGAFVAIDKFFGVSDSRIAFTSALMGILAIRRQIIVQRAVSEANSASAADAGKIVLHALDSMASISRAEFTQWTEAFRAGLAKLEADTTLRLAGKAAGQGGAGKGMP